MKNVALVISLLLPCEIVDAQKINTTVYKGCSTEKQSDGIYVGHDKNYQSVIFDRCPEFYGGEKAAEQYFQILSKNSEIKPRTVYVSFIIEKDGRLTQGTVVHSVSPYIDNLALQLIKLSPKWRPGILKGKPVRILYVFPVKIIKS